MSTATCPRCQNRIEGSLADITRHVKSCGGTLKKGQKSTQGVPLPSAKECPRLPWTITVPLLISSQNKTQYSHWSVYKRGKDQWRVALSLLVAPVQGLRFQWSHWTITRCWGPPRRELDYGNLVGGAKPCADCLIELGVIVDDKPANFHCDYVQRRVTGASFTEITLLRIADVRPPDFIQ